MIKNLLYILLFAPLALFGQTDSLVLKKDRIDLVESSHLSVKNQQNLVIDNLHQFQKSYKVGLAIPIIGVLASLVINDSNDKIICIGVTSILGAVIRFGSFSNLSKDNMVFIYGCTNPNSHNFNPQANIDDGSCITQMYIDGSIEKITALKVSLIFNQDDYVSYKTSYDSEARTGIISNIGNMRLSIQNEEDGGINSIFYYYLEHISLINKEK